MYWRAKNERFVRPVRWLVALLDGDVVPLEFDGVRAGRESSGHRTLGGTVTIRSPRAYETDLEQAAVVASRAAREQRIRKALDDARFVWQTDQKISLRDRVPLLKHVTFQKDLGSYYDKTIRVQRLASHISGRLKESGLEIRPGVVHKSACLAKTDLTTELVKEFTE